MKELLDKLDKELTEQTRNGRTEVYIDADDLNQIGINIDENKKGRTWIDASYLRLTLNRYMFMENLRVDTRPVKTFRQLEKEIKQIEKGEREE